MPVVGSFERWPAFRRHDGYSMNEAWNHLSKFSGAEWNCAVASLLHLSRRVRSPQSAVRRIGSYIQDAAMGDNYYGVGRFIFWFIFFVVLFHLQRGVMPETRYKEDVMRYAGILNRMEVGAWVSYESSLETRYYHELSCISRRWRKSFTVLGASYERRHQKFQCERLTI